MLFCPFCREAFDEVQRCPDHDVELVTLRELGQLSAARVPDEQRLPVWSARSGRGWLGLGVLGTLVGFFLPFGRLVSDVDISSSLLTLARGRALRLWVVPVAALGVLLMLWRRRSPAAMRGARLGALLMAVSPSGAVVVTWYGARAAAEAMATKAGGPVVFELGLGSWLVFVSGVLLVVGSVRLGMQRAARVR